jgi:hypothetical protein
MDFKAHTVDQDSNSDGDLEQIDEEQMALAQKNRNTINASLAAKAYLPDAASIKKQLLLMDLGIKFQIMLFELSSSIFWVSFIEVTFFFTSFVLFLTSPRMMPSIWLHVLHIPRAAIGGLLVWKMPNTHDMLAESPIPQNDKIPLDEITKYAVLGVQKSLRKFSSAGSKFLIGYFAVTSLCIILDVVDFFIGVARFSTHFYDGTYGAICILVISSIFITLDLYYYVWAFAQSIKLPAAFKKSVVLATLGIFT